jgi:hypothetical protein
VGDFRKKASPGDAFVACRFGEGDPSAINILTRRLWRGSRRQGDLALGAFLHQLHLLFITVIVEQAHTGLNN